MKKLFKGFKGILFFIVAIISFGTVAFAETPVVVAESAILVEAGTGKILFEKDIHKKMYPASTTKILTALVTLDYFDPDALITVGREINEVPLDSSKAGHKVGETLTVRNLIRGMIIPSGNDSSTVITVAVARKSENNESLSYAACEEVFAKLLNEKASALGCKESNFVNSHGYHDPDHYTTVYDMSLIAIAGMENSVISEIAGEKGFSGTGMEESSLEPETSLTEQQYSWTSHNLLITNNQYNYEYATGIKTGFTDEAGDCVAASAEKDEFKLIAVIFNSEDPGRWLDARDLFNYGFDNFSYHDIVKAGDILGKVGLTNHKSKNGDTLDFLSKEDLTVVLSNEEAERIEETITYDSVFISDKGNESEVILKAPITKGTQIGTLSYTLDGKSLGELPIFAAEDVEEASIFEKLMSFLKNLKDSIFTLKTLIILFVITIILVLLVLTIKIKRNRRKKYKYKIKKFKH